MTSIADLPQRHADGRAANPSGRRRALADTRARSEPREEPFQGIHPLAFRLPMVAAAWFVLSMAISFADTGQTAYLMAIVAGFAVIFFGLTVGLGMRASDSRRLLASPATFQRFVRSTVSVYTGRISGREALVQITVLPVTLALGGMAIGLVYIFMR